MIMLITLAIVVGVFLLFKKSKPEHPQPVRHFEVRRDDFMWVFTVRPVGFVMPTVLLAMIPGAVIAVVVLGVWLKAGHDLDTSGSLFFFAWAAGTAGSFGPMKMRARKKAAGVTFSVGPGGVVLPDGGGVTITGQYVLNRRNSAKYGEPAALAHYVSLDVDGYTYVLADGMSDIQSNALYHEVGRRLRGDP